MFAPLCDQAAHLSGTHLQHTRTAEPPQRFIFGSQALWSWPPLCRHGICSRAVALQTAEITSERPTLIWDPRRGPASWVNTKRRGAERPRRGYRLSDLWACAHQYSDNGPRVQTNISSLSGSYNILYTMTSGLEQNCLLKGQSVQYPYPGRQAKGASALTRLKAMLEQHFSGV